MTDRLICRIFFLGCCLAPTLVVGGWAAAIHSPAYRNAQREQWQRHASRQLGLDVRVERVRMTRDGELQLGRVELRVPDQDLLLASAENVRVRTASTLALKADEISIHRDHWRRLWETLEHRWLRPPLSEIHGLTLAAPALRVHWGRRQFAAAATTCTLAVRDATRHCQVHVSMPEGSLAGPWSLSLARTLHDGSAATKVVLAAESAHLPAGMLSADLAQFTGEDALFQGQFVAQQASSGASWVAQGRGSLRSVDLGQLAPSAPDLVVEATADVELEMAHLVDGRLTVAEGRLKGRSGRISGAALQWLCTSLGIFKSPPVDQGLLPHQAASFDRLDASFGLSHKGLWVQGRCPVYRALPGAAAPRDAAGSTEELAVLLAGVDQPVLQSLRYSVRSYFVNQTLLQSRADNAAVQRRAPYFAGEAVATRPRSDKPLE